MLSLGGRFGYTTRARRPTPRSRVIDFGDTQLIFEVRGLQDRRATTGEKVGNIVHLEEGTIAGDKFYPKGSDEAEPLSKLASRSTSSAGRATATSATSSRPSAAARPRTSTPTSSKATTPRPSATWPTSRTGWASEVPFNKQTKAFGDDKEAYETLARMEEHLKDNGVKLDGLNYRLGRKLTFDAATESFAGDAEANQLLTRPYRKPFVVPDRIA